MDPDTIWQAIFGQESNYGRNNKTSVTGARGPGQIQPETFRAYAMPGEKINNFNDNISVSKRIVQDYYNRFGGDPARIATAYFSGPNNVTPSNNPRPYVQDRADPTGKKVSSYVSDISGRLKQMPQANFYADAAFGQWEAATSPKGNNFNPDAAFSQWEKPKQQVAPQPASPSGSRVPIPPENMTPQQLAEYQAGIQRGKEGPPSFLSQYHPLAAIPETVSSGVAQLGQGIKQIQSGQVASGAGNIGMGALSTIAGPFIGPISETARFGGTVIGNPQAANIASLVLPTKGAGTAIKSQIPTVRAQTGLINLIGKENVPNVLAKLEANPNLSLMDVSEPVRTVSAGLANNPETPAAQNIMRSAYERRVSERQGNVQTAVANTLGPPMNVKDVTEQLSENLRKVGDKLIEPALAEAKPVGVKPIIDRLDSVIESPNITAATKTELERVRKQLAANGPDAFVDPSKLHNIQWPLRAEAENLAKSASGAERNMSKPLMKVRQDLVDAIDTASGGKYKPALAQYRHASMVPEAMDRGFNILKTKGVEDFPEYWQAWAKEASPQELAAAKVGAISAVRQTIEGLQSGARRGEAIMRPTFVRERFSSIFSKKQTDQLANLLEDASNMADTNALLYRNSKTAQVTAGQQFFQPRQVGAPAGAATSIGAGTLGAMASALGYPEAGLVAAGFGALKGAHIGTQYLGKLADKATATRFAEMASATGPERNQLIKLLRSASESSGGNKTRNLIPSLVRLAAP